MSRLLLSILSLLSFISCTLCASLEPVQNFGQNPTNVAMYIYVPASLSPNPPIIVAIHYCTGTAQAYFSNTRYASLADQHGFIVIYPSAPDSGGCWDVHTNATLTHNAGGDSLGIASMVRYTLQKYNGNPSRVFATGTSSGAMMTNVLAGAYPDLFRAGSAYSGVPYGCFEGIGMWNSDCAQGKIIKTAQQWGDLARSGYPGYTGPRTRMQLWHGTVDAALYYQNLIEADKQWSNVLGVGFTKNVTNVPLPGYTQLVYGDGSLLVSYSAAGVGHTVPVREDYDLDFFGITK